MSIAAKLFYTFGLNSEKGWVKSWARKLFSTNPHSTSFSNAYHTDYFAQIMILCIALIFIIRCSTICVVEIETLLQHYLKFYQPWQFVCPIAQWQIQMKKDIIWLPNVDGVKVLFSPQKNYVLLFLLILFFNQCD